MIEEGGSEMGRAICMTLAWVFHTDGQFFSENSSQGRRCFQGYPEEGSVNRLSMTRMRV